MITVKHVGSMRPWEKGKNEEPTLLVGMGPPGDGPVGNFQPGLSILLVFNFRRICLVALFYFASFLFQGQHQKVQPLSMQPI